VSSVIDPRKIQKDLPIPKGAVLYDFDDQYNKLNMLESGSVQFIAKINDSGNERLLGEIKTKRFILPHLLFGENNNPLKIISSMDCIINSYPFYQNTLSFFSQNPLIARSIFVSLIADFNEIYSKIKSFYEFSFKVEKLYDNLILAIALGKLNKNLIVFSDDSFNLFQISKDYEEKFKSQNGFFPGVDNPNFLGNDNSRFIQKKYEFSMERLSCNQDILNIAFSFRKTPLEVMDSIYKNTYELPFYICKTFSKELDSLIASFIEIIVRTESYLIRIFSHPSNLSYVLLKGINDKLGKEKCLAIFSTVYASYQNFAEFYKNFFQLISLPFNLNFKNDLLYLIETTKKSTLESVAQPEKKGKEAVSSIISDILSKNENSSFSIDSIIIGEKKSSQLTTSSKFFSEICSFANFPADETKIFSKALDTFIKQQDKTADNEINRKVQKAIRTLYFKLYEKTFIKSLNTKQYPKAVDYFLKFGIIDERLLTQEDLNVIINFSDNSYSDYEIYYPYDWFSLIYNEKIEPSISDLGQSFAEIEREEAKRYKKVKEEEIPINLKKLKFEIENFYQTTYRVLTSSPLTALPIFFSENVRGKLSDLIITREKIANELDWLRSIDYSLFWRESIYRQEDIFDIYKKEVLPYIIIIPGIGDRIFMWQDSGTNKYMPARFVFPSVFTGSDLRKSVALACAAYRWENNKTMKGPAWADATAGGITGAYVDYLQTYQKSTELSIEAKKTIKEQLSKFRSDREKFANDYIQWIFYESEGILKLNSLLRRIFIFEIPFKKEVLLQLQRLPAFEKLVTTFINRRKMEIRSNINRYRKFEDQEKNLPDEIQKFMDFLKN